jgi:predicted DNA-binding protein
MGTMVSVRMSTELRRSVERIAKRRKCAASVVMREAVESFVEKEESGTSFYDAIKDLVGVVHGGDPGRSMRNMGEELRAKRAGR